MTQSNSSAGEVHARMTTPGIGEIIISRTPKRNAFTPKMLKELAGAFSRWEREADVRVVFLHAEGEHFTGGLDLAAMNDAGMMGAPLFPPGEIDPVGLFGQSRTKPLVMAVEGYCYTLGLELLLAADISVASETARFAQIEVQRSVLAYCGATLRMPARLGWGNAMRYLLTGDEFDAHTALRLGLVQEVTPPGEAFESALAIAQRIAAAAPLAVRETLENARTGVEQGFVAALNGLLSSAQRVAGSQDAQEGVAAFVEKRRPDYKGR